ncbi:MAG: hypothetical protein ACFFE5_07590 [Candidatus Thorarchaeota archaeon]
MGEESREMTAPKIIYFIGMLFLLFDAVAYFWLSSSSFTGDGLLNLFGVLNLIFIIIMFLSLELVGTGRVKIPYFWWLILIIGVISIIFSYLIANFWNYGEYFVGLLEIFNVTPIPYFTGSLIILAVLMEVAPKIKDLKSSKVVAIVGILFTIFDCVVMILLATETFFLITAIFGIILAVILLIIVLGFIDIRIPNNWWVVLTFAFAIYIWVVPTLVAAWASTFVPLTGFGGLFLLIVVLLMLFGM